MKAELDSQQKADQGGTNAETNGGGGGGSSPGSEAESAPVTPPESQSPLHFLADLAEQKAREEKKGEDEEGEVLRRRRLDCVVIFKASRMISSNLIQFPV